MPTVYNPVIPTYVALGTATLSADASVTFSTIPATYRDLVLVVGAAASANGNLSIRLNGDTGSNYSHVRMYAVSGGSGSDSYTGARSENGSTTTGQGVTTINIMDYSATDRHKTILSRLSWAGTSLFAHANRWANTGAVTSLEVYNGDTGNLTGTVSLYGIEA